MTPCMRRRVYVSGRMPAVRNSSLSFEQRFRAAYWGLREGDPDREKDSAAFIAVRRRYCLIAAQALGVSWWE